MPHELIVREIFSTNLNATSVVALASETVNNVARFFNDTAFDLNLVALRVGALLEVDDTAADASSDIFVFLIAEVSRQAQILQQEGILANVRATAGNWGKTAALGGSGGLTHEKGEIVIGNFKDIITVVPDQTSVFLNIQFANGAFGGTMGIGSMEAFTGASLYFRRGRPAHR